MLDVLYGLYQNIKKGVKKLNLTWEQELSRVKTILMLLNCRGLWRSNYISVYTGNITIIKHDLSELKRDWLMSLWKARHHRT